MKVLFLDIDGVVCLHKDKDWDNEEEIFDAACCRKLQEIVSATGCKLVLSSSWRLFPESIRSMFRQLKPFGITRENFLGRTPLRGERGDEIMAYLKKRPQIETFVALDDDRLILTKPESGITENVKNACIRKLNG